MTDAAGGTHRRPWGEGRRCIGQRGAEMCSFARATTRQTEPRDTRGGPNCAAARWIGGRGREARRSYHQRVGTRSRVRACRAVIACAAVALSACATPIPPSVTSDPSRVPAASPLPVVSPLPTVSVPPVESTERTCENREVGYRVSYPTDWFVHPEDASLAVEACAQFSIEPFDFEVGALPGGGGNVWIRPFSGGCLIFELEIAVDEIEAVSIGALPAYRIESRFPDGRRGHEYVVNLHPDAPVIEAPALIGGPLDPDCADTAGLILGTREGLSGDFVTNRMVVDRMATTFELIDD
jgi:hypothetical protein